MPESTPPELTVRHVMHPDPIVVSPTAKVGDVLHRMNEARAGSVIVCDAAGGLVGIFTERDLLLQVAVAVPGWRDYVVSDWMTANPHAIAPDIGWEEAVTTMSKWRVRHLPVVESGRVIGVLSTRMLMSRRTEYLNQRVAERTYELKKANDELIARDQELAYNLRAAGTLQKWFLPHAPPTWPELDTAVHFAPLDSLGGDYYDFAYPDDQHLGFLIADASGHSVAAAMVAIMARFAFAEVADTSSRPGEVLTQLNRRLVGATGDRFLTACYGVLDRRTRTFRYASAGHPPPLRYEAATGHIKPLAAQGFLIGIMPDEVYAEREVTLAPGDVLCFYTDGLIEALNEIGEQYGNDRLIDSLSNSRDSDARTILAEILACHARFSGAVKPADDVTVAVCRVTA